MASELPLAGVYSRPLPPLSVSCLLLPLTLSCDVSYCPNGDKKAGQARCPPPAVRGTHTPLLSLSPFHHSEEIAVPSSSSRWLPFCLTPPTLLLPQSTSFLVSFAVFSSLEFQKCLSAQLGSQPQTPPVLYSLVSRWGPDHLPWGPDSKTFGRMFHRPSNTIPQPGATPNTLCLLISENHSAIYPTAPDKTSRSKKTSHMGSACRVDLECVDFSPSEKPSPEASSPGQH